jgi:hypothetical protein
MSGGGPGEDHITAVAAGHARSVAAAHAARTRPTARYKAYRIFGAVTDAFIDGGQRREG